MHCPEPNPLDQPCQPLFAKTHRTLAAAKSATGSMKRRPGERCRFGLIAAGVVLVYQAAALNYSDNQQLARQLQQLASNQPSLVRVRPVVKSLGNQEVWLLEIGSGSEEQRKNNPAFLLVAGIEGNDL